LHSKIKYTLWKRKIKQSDAAEACQMSRITLNRYLSGHTQIGADDLLALFEFLGWELLIPKEDIENG
jgi:transcriptional regulator with XRE-family HTH domain